MYRLYTGCIGLLIVTVAVLGTLYLLHVSHDRTTAYHMYELQQVCDQSHVSVNGSLEEQCGTVQDTYSMEYLCSTAEIDAHCWVEVK